jgi:hypothetical protein
MNETTINRLRNNPHYRFNGSQKQELKKLIKEPIIETGVMNIPQRSEQELEIHPTGMTKRRRSKRKIQHEEKE